MMKLFSNFQLVVAVRGAEFSSFRVSKSASILGRNYNISYIMVPWIVRHRKMGQKGF